MNKIKDGTYRAMRSDASGYVYGNYVFRHNRHYIKEDGLRNFSIVPIYRETLVYRENEKWVKA